MESQDTVSINCHICNPLFNISWINPTWINLTQLPLLSPGLTHHFLPALNSKPAPILLSTTRSIHPRWKDENRRPKNPNAYGVLTDSPDYTFLDGRPTPYGPGQKRRIEAQKELAEEIIKLTGEVDFAVERHRKLEEEKQEEVRRIIDGKFKPKGKHLIKHVKSLGWTKRLCSFVTE